MDVARPSQGSYYATSTLYEGEAQMTRASNGMHRA